MKRKLPFLSVLAFAFVGLSATALAEDCFDDVCVDFSDVGGYYLLTVTDADDGSPLEVKMTEIPSNLSPGGGGTAPPTQPYSEPDTQSSMPILHGPESGTSDTLRYTFRGARGTWIVNITLTYDGDGNLIDVDANVVYNPHENEER